jgi:hypothetical protein
MQGQLFVYPHPVWLVVCEVSDRYINHHYPNQRCHVVDYMDQLLSPHGMFRMNDDLCWMGTTFIPCQQADLIWQHTLYHVEHCFRPINAALPTTPLPPLFKYFNTKLASYACEYTGSC